MPKKCGKLPGEKSVKYIKYLTENGGTILFIII